MAPINADPAIAADRAAIAISTWLSPKILPEEKPPPIFSKPPKLNDRPKKYIKVAKKQTMGGKAARAAAPSPFAPPENLSGEPERRQIPYRLEHDENVRENYGARCFRKRAAEPRPPSWRAGARGRYSAKNMADAAQATAQSCATHFEASGNDGKITDTAEKSMPNSVKKCAAPLSGQKKIQLDMAEVSPRSSSEILCRFSMPAISIPLSCEKFQTFFGKLPRCGRKPLCRRPRRP